MLPNFMKSKPEVAVIDLAGTIQAGRGGQLGANRRLNIANLEKSIDKAFSYKRLKSVLLNINSPGGSPAQSELIANKITRLGKQKNVKVYSFVEDLAVSGGYWLACAGEEIYATNNSFIGSIGVINARFGFDQFIKRYDLDWRVHTAGKSKSFMDPFQPEKEEDVVKIKHLLTAIHQNFIDHVKKSRGGRLNANDDLLFNGDVWLAQDAIKYGLIDGIDDVSNFVEQRYGKVGEDVRLIRVNSPSANRFGLGGLFGGIASPLDVQKDLYSKRFDVM